MSTRVAAAAPPARPDLAVLVQLATVAMGPLGAPLLPDGWALFSTFPGDSPPIPGQRGQGFVATGTLAGQAVTVLSLGLPWTSYLGMNPNLTFGLTAVAPPIVPTDGPQIETNLLAAYTGMREALWAAVAAAAGNGPLYITGMGTGGPLAQLATLDLRPGNKGPGGQPAPGSAPTLAVFSSPGPGNAAFAAALGQMQGAAATVGLAALGVTIDRFPLVAATAPAGPPVVAASRLPTPYDDPWLERGPGAYATALDPDAPWYPPSPAEARITNPPAGFDPLRAASCARLCAVTYMLAQRPGLISVASTAPYTLQSLLTANGAVQGAVFVSALDIVVAFRGAITFFEFVTTLANTFAQDAAFIDANFFTHAGACVLYASGGPPSLQAQLWAALAAAGPKRPVCFTGHDLGGALAVLAAADQLANHKDFGAPVVYGFGTCRVGSAQMPSSPVFPALNAASFMVARTADFLPRAPLIGSLLPFGQAVNLAGVPPNDEPTAHGISGYARLLSPWA
jgi:hypothetical protein